MDVAGFELNVFRILHVIGNEKRECCPKLALLSQEGGIKSLAMEGLNAAWSALRGR